MKRFLKFALVLGPPLIAVGWTFLVTNFFGIALDQATFSAPGNGNVPVYNSTSKTWKVGSAGGTVGIQLNGSPVTGSPASTINLQNGLTVVGNVTGGVATIQPNYGTGPSTVPPGNDTRFNSAPSAAGKLSVDTGSAWHSLAAGAANTLLHGAGAADPTYSQLVDADITAGTITAGSMASTVTNRLMLTPATIGRIEVDGGVGNPPVALAQGTSVQFLQSGGAAANPGFVSFSGDFTVAAGGLATLASTISAAGPIGDGTHVAQITFDAKGRLTAVSSVAITASGSTIALQNGGSGVTGSPAGTLNATNGLTFGTVSAGVSALAPTYGVLVNTVQQGNDTRNNAAPSAAGKLSVDTGSAWHSIAAGAANTLLHGAGAADPTYSAVALADMATQAAKTVLANATNATAVPSAVGGTADQFFQINHANTALGFVSMTGDATLSDGTLTIGTNKVSLPKITNAAANSRLVGSGSGGSGASYTELTVDATMAIGASSVGVAAGGIGDAQLSSSGTLIFATGMMLDYCGTTAPSGWVLSSGRTIGDASSGATERANADTSALFTLLWNNWANAQAAVSGGRGANAAADFAAHKTIVLPDSRGKVIAGKDNMGGSTAGNISVAGGNFDATVMGSTGGAQNHTLSIGEMPAHVHDETAFAIGGGSTEPTEQPATGSGLSTGINTGSTGGGGAHTILQATLVVTKIIKL